MMILNLGCGTKTHPELINIDWSIYARLLNSKLLSSLVKPFLSGERLKKFNDLPDNILVHDLSKGIPFANDSIDVVYHSHFLEHLDREDAEPFLIEVRRVLRAGGIQRIVVPDFEKLSFDYIDHLKICDKNIESYKEHDNYIAAIISQCVMKEALSTSMQPPIWRLLENLLLGDARKRGITHQWLYDRINLEYLLKKIGFREVKLEKYNTSSIPDWNRYGLDLDSSCNEYKPESLYMEAIK